MVCGSRTINDYSIVKKELDKYDIDLIINGNAKGVDKLAIKYAEENNIKHKEFVPQWHIYGKAAGPIRNLDMVEFCDKGIAFWDGKSEGTKDSIKKLAKRNKLLKIKLVQ